MTRFRRRVTWCASALVLLVLPPEGGWCGDSPAVSVGGGYAFLRDIGRFWPDESFPRGFFVFGTLELNRAIGITGEVSSSFETYEIDPRLAPVNPSVEFLDVSFGPQIAFRQDARVSPFFHVLGGISRIEGTSSQNVSWSETNFALQLGGGADIRLHERVSLRGQADFRTLFEDVMLYQLRFAAGASVHFGRESAALRGNEDRLPPLEAGGGFAISKDYDRDDNRPGWWLSGAVGVHRVVAIEGEFSRVVGVYEQYVNAWMIGPRFSFMTTERFRPFVRALLGWAERQRFYGDYWDTAAGVTLQPGGGLDIVIAPPISFRVAVDYRPMFEEFGTTHQLRFATGIVGKFGGDL